MILGIDPGYAGGIARYKPSEGVFLGCEAIPLIGDKKARDYDIGKLWAIVGGAAQENATIYIEAFASFGFGAHEVRSLVRCITIVEMLAREWKVPFYVVPSKTWQKEAFEGTDKEMKPKARATIAAERIFGSVSRTWSGGVRDAALIAWYGSRKT